MRPRRRDRSEAASAACTCDLALDGPLVGVVAVDVHERAVIRIVRKQPTLDRHAPGRSIERHSDAHAYRLPVGQHLDVGPVRRQPPPIGDEGQPPRDQAGDQSGDRGRPREGLSRAIKRAINRVIVGVEARGRRVVVKAL